ncbi:MAG: BamA/TamA family outer membrane protein, partial [Gemmatimonadales bacterium]|nr:BamA/TamA family outer membrane protein [Gemmatimonadales bacterium]
QAPAAPADSLRAGEPTWWGPWPARSDSNSARFLDRPLPLWEKTVLVPHFLAGLPFRLIHHTTEATLTYMDNLGWFELPPTRHMGLALPWGGYLMPSIAASGLEGVTTGLSILRPNLGGPENRAYVKGSISTRHAEQLAGGMYLKLGPKTGLQLGGGLAEMSKMLYYGLGPSSDIGARSYYERISAWGGLEIDHLLGRGVRADFMTFFSQVRVTESEDEPERSISLVHDGRLPFGFPGESSGWTVRLGLLRNTTHENGRPAEGNFSRISADYFHASDGSDLRYLRYHASHEQFFPLWLTERTLGLRAFFNRIQNTGTLDVPFSRLVAFSRPDELRGFSSMRFSGLGSLGFSGEYRWPVWMRYRHGSTGVDGYLFCETGQVFNRRQEITLPNFEITGGFGFRLVSAEGKFVGRIEMGFSDEETVFSLSLGQNFQRDRRGLLYGKDPTRKR